LGYSLTPLIIVLYIKILENKIDFLQIFLITILLTIFSLSSTHNIFYIFPILFFINVYYYITTKKNEIVLKIILIIIFYVFLNFYWILPTIYKLTKSEITPSYNFSIIEIERLSLLNSPQNVFRMISGGGWKEILQLPMYVSNLSIFLLFFFPIISFSAIIFFPKNRIVLLLSIMFIVLFLLSLGTHSPLPIYYWILDIFDASIIWIFRDPSRLIQYVVLTYSLLWSFTIYKLVTGKSNKKEIISILGILFILIILLFSPATYTYINKGGNRLVSSQPPSEYMEIYSFLKNEPGNFKILWLPLRHYQYYEWNKVKDDVCGDFYLASSPKPTYGFTTSTNYGVTRFFKYIYFKIFLDYRSETLGSFLNLYGIKYIIVHTDLLNWQKIEAQKIIQILLLQKDIKFVKQIGPYYIFENTKYESNIFSTFSNINERVFVLPLLSSENLFINITNISNWRTLPNNYLSTDVGQNLLVWNVVFNEKQERYGIKINLGNINAENFDKLRIKIIPKESNIGRELSVTIYTNESSFVFNRYELKAGVINDELFDLRKAKLIQASKGQNLNLKNVTSISIDVYEKFYNKSSNATFYIKEISFVFDSSYGLYDPEQLLNTDNWLIKNKENMIHRYIKINPTKYIINISATKHFMLSFTQSYDPLWEARVYKNGKLVEKSKPVPLYGVINGFWINTTGENLEIVIRYTPQDYFEIGLIISGTTLAACIAYLIYDWKRDFFDEKIRVVLRKKKYRYNIRKLN
jgi:hypothetical protein